MSINAYRSNAIPSIYNLAYTSPFDIRRLKMTLNHELKLSSTLPTLDFKQCFKCYQNLFQEKNSDIFKILTITPTLIPDRKILLKPTLNFLY